MNIYKFAMQMERDGEQFYEQAEQASKASTKAILVELADEEQRHYFLLEGIVELVGRPSTWIEDAEFNHLDEY